MRARTTKNKTSQPISIFSVAILCSTLSMMGILDNSPLDYSGMLREAIAEISFVGLLMYWFYTNRQIKQAMLTLSATRVFLVGLLLLASLSILWAPSIDFFFSKYLLWIATGATIFLALTMQPTHKSMLSLARLLTLISVYISIVGLLQSMLSIDIFMQHRSPAANFGNKNISMQVIVLTFPMMFFLLLFDQHKYFSKLYFFAVAIVLAYAYHTQTRGAWLALLVESIVIIAGFLYYRTALGDIVKERKINWGVEHKLAAILALVLTFLLVFSHGKYELGGIIHMLSEKVTSIQSDLSSYGAALDGNEAVRYKLWDAALKMIQASPFFGTGMGSFYYNLLTNSAQYTVFLPLRVHNDLLETGIELGIVGLVLLLGAIIGLLMGLYRLITNGDTPAKIFYWLVASALLGSAINMQFSFPYQMPATLIILGLYIGFTIKGSDSYNPRLKTISFPVKRAHWYVGVTGVGCVLIFILALNFSWLIFMSSLSKGIKTFTWEVSPQKRTLMCHKSSVAILYYLADIYHNNGFHKSSQKALKLIDQCVADTWLAKQKKSRNLISLNRISEATKVLERSKNQSPIGLYPTHINLLVIYKKKNDLPSVRRIYNEFSSKPEALLIKQRKTLRTLILTGLFIKNTEDARKFYKLHEKYYPDDRQFRAGISKLLF